MIPQGDSDNIERHPQPGRVPPRAATNAASILDALESAVLVIGANGAIQFANGAVQRVAGLRPTDCVGRCLGAAIPALACLDAHDLVVSARNGDAPRRVQIDVAGNCATGSYDVVATPCGDGVCIELRPASDLVAAEHSAARARNAFLTTVSHELRTPLTALTGYGELLAEQILGPLNDTQCDMVDRMCSVTHHLSMMIEEILTYSSLEAGQEVVRPTSTTPAEIVHAATAEIAPQAKMKGIAIELDVPRNVGAMHTDGDKVRQILVHLAGNAVKFTERGSIRIQVVRDGSLLRFGVRDTGIGIDPSSFDRVFQPFVQLDAGLTRRHGGTGLGLYISQRLASLLGGHIEVASEAGRGSLFTLVLPDRYQAARGDQGRP